MQEQTERFMQMAGTRLTVMTTTCKGGNCTLDGIVTVDDKKYYISKRKWMHERRMVPHRQNECTGASFDLVLCFCWTVLCTAMAGRILTVEDFIYEGANAPRNAWVNMDEKRYYFGENGPRECWFQSPELLEWRGIYQLVLRESDGDVRRAGFSDRR